MADMTAGSRRMGVTMREAASLHVRALEPSVDERPLTTHAAGHRAREAKPGPSAKAVINVAGPECVVREATEAAEARLRRAADGQPAAAGLQ